MVKYFEHSIKEQCSTNREILQKMYNHALVEREKKKLSYRPHTINPYVDIVRNTGVDFADFFEESEEGDYAFWACHIDGLYEKELLLNVSGSGVKEVYFNGELQKLKSCANGSEDARVIFRKGKNTLVVRVTASKEGFSGYANPLVPKLRMIPTGYVYYTRQYIETEGFKGQSGVMLSRLYHKDEPVPEITESTIEWVFPVMPKQEHKKCFHFEELCEKGQAAYVYTSVCGKVIIEHESPLKVFSAGHELYHRESGRFEWNFTESTPLLIKSGRGTNSWGFEVVVEGTTELPFVEGADYSDLQWIYVGPFGREGDSVDYPYAPESNLQFKEPYLSISAGMVYWKFYRPDTYLKQYMESSFYGQWFYAEMVGLYGLKLAAEKLEKKEFWEYFMSGMKLLCQHRNYSVYDAKLSGRPSYLSSSVNLKHLDPIGTIGINVAEYYLMSGDAHAKYLLQLLADSLYCNVPRFEDGTFHRVETMWTDDMYMSLPFLARMGAITGESKYFDDIVAQIKGFYKRMFMEDQGIFSHIYYVKEECQNCIPWGRGNGWVLLALSEVLLLMPKTYEGYEFVLEIYQKFAVGVLACRDKEKGIWHQVLNNPESYIETSGSAMFIIALARGVKHNWIAKEVKEEVLEAWEELTERCIDSEGNVYGICMGSGCSMDEAYYMNLQTIVNDDHGVGIVLEAGVAVMEMQGDELL